jgi:hypothetical protein
VSRPRLTRKRGACGLPVERRRENVSKLWINETWVNATRGHGIGDSGVYETSYEEDERGALYRVLVKEYGRCVSKVYIDREGGPPKVIGWVFIQRAKYTDSSDTYIRETWVTLHKAPPTVVTEHHYIEEEA